MVFLDAETHDVMYATQRTLFGSMDMVLLSGLEIVGPTPLLVSTASLATSLTCSVEFGRPALYEEQL